MHDKKNEQLHCMDDHMADSNSAQIFLNKNFAFDWGLSTSVKEKNRVTQLVTERGGEITYNVKTLTSYLIADVPPSNPYKRSQAEKYCVPIVSLSFIMDCVQENKLLDTAAYLIHSLDSGKSHTSEQKRTLFPKDQEQRDENIEHFDKDHYDIVKFSLLEGEGQYYMLELHVSTETEPKQYQVFKQSVAKRTCQEDHRPMYSPISSYPEAVQTYSKTFETMMSPPYNMKPQCQLPPLTSLGSPRFKQMKECSPSPGMLDLLGDLWLETCEAIQSMLAVKLEDIKLEMVERALGIGVGLLMRPILENGLNGVVNSEKITELSAAFYETLPLIPADTINNIKQLAYVNSVCQTLWDVVSLLDVCDKNASHMDIYLALYPRPAAVNVNSVRWADIIRAIQDPIHGVPKVRNILSLTKTSEKLKTSAKEYMSFCGADPEDVMRTLSRVGRNIHSDEENSETHYRNFSECLSNCKVHHSRQSQYVFVYISSDPTKPDVVSDHHWDKEETVLTEAEHRLVYLIEVAVNGDGLVRDIYGHRNRPQLNRNTSAMPCLQGCILDICQTVGCVSASHEDENQNFNLGLQSEFSSNQIGLVTKTNVKSYLPLIAVNVTAEVMDMVSKVTIEQMYINNTDDIVEVEYTFPMLDKGALTQFEAVVNGRHLHGEIQEKKVADQVYREAMSEDRTAVLLEQDTQDASILRMKLGKVPAGSVVEITVKYLKELEVLNDRISLQLPPLTTHHNLLDMFNSRLQRPTVAECSLQISVNMPFDIKSLTCSTHRTEVVERSATNALLKLSEDQRLSEGFHLLIGMAEINTPRMWVEKHPIKQNSQACMVSFGGVHFPEDDTRQLEVLFLVDVSHSMAWKPLIDVLNMALVKLPASVKFNIFTFGNRVEELFPSSQWTTASNKATARSYILGLKPKAKSTNLLQALTHIDKLVVDNNNNTSVCVISDGWVSQGISAVDVSYRGKNHFQTFTLGVGNRVNYHLLTSLAMAGGGACEVFDTNRRDQWGNKVKSLLNKMGKPHIEGGHIHWCQYNDNAPPVEASPTVLQPIFSSSSCVAYAFTQDCQMAYITGKVNGHDISVVASTPDLCVTEGMFLHTLAANSLIQDWQFGMLGGTFFGHEAKKFDMKQRVIQLSKEYSILSPLTSFVAVERDSTGHEIEAIVPQLQQDLRLQDQDKKPDVHVVPRNNVFGSLLTNTHTKSNLEQSSDGKSSLSDSNHSKIITGSNSEQSSKTSLGFSFSSKPTNILTESNSEQSSKTTSGFVFGSQPTTTQTGKNSEQSSKTSLGFSFGSKPTNILTETNSEQSSKTSLGFSFGSKPTTILTETNSEQSSKTSSGFSFGSKPTNTKAGSKFEQLRKTSSEFSFGSQPATTETGSSSKQTSNTSSAFSFGSYPADTKTLSSSEQSSKTSAGFSFGSPPADTQTSSKLENLCKTSSGFSFGSPAATTETGSSSEQSSKTPSAFSFGSYPTNTRNRNNSEVSGKTSTGFSFCSHPTNTQTRSNSKLAGFSLGTQLPSSQSSNPGHSGQIVSVGSLLGGPESGGTNRSKGLSEKFGGLSFGQRPSDSHSGINCEQSKKSVGFTVPLTQPSTASTRIQSKPDQLINKSLCKSSDSTHMTSTFGVPPKTAVIHTAPTLGLSQLLQSKSESTSVPYALNRLELKSKGENKTETTDKKVTDVINQQKKEAGNEKSSTSEFGLSGQSLSFGLSAKPAGFGTSAQPTGFGASAQPTGFGSSSQPTGFGSSAQPTGFGSSAPSTGFGSSAQPTVFGTNAQQTGFGTSAQPTGFGTSAQPTGFGTSAQSTGFGLSSQPTGFGSSAQSTGFGTSAQPTGFGSSAQSTGFGTSAQPTGFGTSAQPTGFGTSAQPTGFGASDQPTGFGTSAQSTVFGSSSQPTGFGSSAQSTGFGASAQPTGFGSSAQQTGFGTSAHPTGFGTSAQPTGFGASAQPTGFGTSAQPTGFGTSAQPTGFGSSSQPTGFGSSAQSTGFGTSAHPTGFGTSAQPTGFGTSDQPTGFGTSAQPTGFGTSAQPTGFGTSAQTTGFGTSDQPTGFGTSAQPTGFGSSSQPTGFGSSAQSTGFGTSAHPTGFGTSAQTTGFGTSAQSTGFGTSAQPTGFGPSAQPTGFIASAQPTGFHSSAQPTGFASSARHTRFGPSIQSAEFVSSTQANAFRPHVQETGFGSSSGSSAKAILSSARATDFGSSAQTTGFGSSAQTTGFGSSAQTTGFGSTAQPVGFALSSGSSAQTTGFSTNVQPTMFESRAQQTGFSDYKAQTNTVDFSAKHSGYGCSAKSNVFGSLAESNVFGSGSQSHGFGSSIQSSRFGSGVHPSSPNVQSSDSGVDSQRRLFGSNVNHVLSGSNAQPGLFGSKSQSGLFGSKVQPGLFGSNNQPGLFGSKVQSSLFGSNQYEGFGGSVVPPSGPDYANYRNGFGPDLTRVDCRNTIQNSKMFDRAKKVVTSDLQPEGIYKRPYHRGHSDENKHRKVILKPSVLGKQLERSRQVQKAPQMPMSAVHPKGNKPVSQNLTEYPQNNKLCMTDLTKAKAFASKVEAMQQRKKKGESRDLEQAISDQWEYAQLEEWLQLFQAVVSGASVTPDFDGVKDELLDLSSSIHKAVTFLNKRRDIKTKGDELLSLREFVTHHWTLRETSRLLEVLDDIEDSSQASVWPPQIVMERSHHNSSLYFSVRCGTAALRQDNLEELFDLQKSTGEWQFTEYLGQFLGVDRELCMHLLRKAGIHSLGQAVSEKVVSTIATLMVLLSLVELLTSKQFPMSRADYKEQVSMATIREDLQTALKRHSKGQEFTEKILLAEQFFRRTNNDYILLYSQLELGDSWEEAVGYFLGYIL